MLTNEVKKEFINDLVKALSVEKEKMLLIELYAIKNDINFCSILAEKTEQLEIAIKMLEKFKNEL